MGFLFGKKKQQKAQLDSDDGLPWGWLYQNKELVDTIFHEAMTFESEISHAKGDLQKYAALKSYVLYLEDGIDPYKKVGAIPRTGSKIEKDKIKEGRESLPAFCHLLCISSFSSSIRMNAVFKSFSILYVRSIT